MGVLIAFLLSLAAGLATSIGGILATHRRGVERGFIAMSLAFAAGAMLFVSFIELLPMAVKSFTADSGGMMAAYGSFFVGIGLVMAIDRLVPKSINPAEIEGREGDMSRSEIKDNKLLMRSGILVGLVLALHNFPEGMSTFFASVQSPSAGLSLVLAVAIHNIPEGIAVAAPVYAATKSRKKAFWWATISGLTEPLGALVGMGLISYVVPQSMFGLMFGLTAGMMVFIAIDELVPAAKRYQTQSHQSVYGMVAGMAVVAVSMILLQL